MVIKPHISRGGGAESGFTLAGTLMNNSLTAVVPMLTALLLSSLNDLQFFFVFLYALLEFSCTKHYR